MGLKAKGEKWTVSGREIYLEIIHWGNKQMDKYRHGVVIKRRLAAGETGMRTSGQKIHCSIWTNSWINS